MKITTGASQTGTLVADWTDNVTVINAPGYSADWALFAGAWDLLREGTNYVSLRAYDIAGNVTFSTDAFRVFKDTTVPSVTDFQAGDDAWRGANTGLYNVDFTDTGGSRLAKFQVRASTNAGVVGPFSPDWTDNITGLNQDAYAADWALASGIWGLLREGTNYISVRAYDNAGSLFTYGSQPFYVLKDTTAPSFVNGAAGGDLNWRNSSGTLHNVDAQDSGGSNLSVYQLSVTTGAARTGIMPVDWTAIASGINSASYAADWALPQAAWDLLPEGTNYVSVRAWDLAGSTGTLIDAFRIFKDTTPPSAVSAQAGEFNWRGLNTGLYDADFADAGGSLLSRFQVRASTTPGAGPYAPDWTDNTLGLNAASYAANWPLTTGVWGALTDSATNYISLRVFDNAGSSFTLTDAFRILKDTTPALITDNQAGDDSWRLAAGTLYNADFSDYGSRVSSAAYAAWTQSAKGGSQSLGWTQIFASTGLLTYTADWSVDFNNAAQGFNYVAVRAWDEAGNLTELVDVFYLKKDTAAPSITDLQAGDTTWYRLNPGAVFNVDFADSGIGLSSAAYEAWTGPGRTGTNVVASSQIFSGAPAASYTADWGLTDAAFTLLAAGTNYISVTAWDALNQSSAAVDLFYILKDTVAPSGIATLSAVTPPAAADEGKLNVYWTAVGDNALAGSASYYMIRYNTGAISDGNFDAVSVFVSTLAPKAAGQAEGVTITGLIPSVTYYAAVKAVDKAGNMGALSNMTSSYAGLDLTPPGAVSDLGSLQGDFQGQINLSWTAPGEGTAGVTNTGTAQGYIVRYATFAVNAGNFSAPGVSSFTQTWTPLAYGSAEARGLDGLIPGATYSIAIKAVDEAGNTGPISNVIVATATPAGAAHGMLVYGDNSANLKYQTWVPPNWSAEADSGVTGSVIRWSVLRSVPVVANQKLAGLLYSDNSLKVLKWNGSAWSDATPAPAPAPGGSATRRFDMAAENLSGRIMTAYYNGTVGAVTYAVWSASASVWAAAPASLPLTSLTGTVNWVRLKSMPGTDRILLTVLDANSDISAAVWNGSAWIDNVNLTAAGSIATKESFDAAWETQTGDALVLWGAGTGTNYRKWFSTGTWAPAAAAGPAIGAAAGANWIRLCTDPASNRIGLSSLDGDTSWNTAVWRPAGTEAWSALPTKDALMSGSAYRMTDCAWGSQSGQLLAVAVDDSGAIDNKFDWITWSAGTWSPASPSVTVTNNNTVFVGSITWLSLIPDPNTDNITALAMDAADDIRSTVWNGSVWAAAGATSNALHEQNGSDHNFEFAAADFDRHDIVPPTVADNQAGDDNWRNASAYYNVDATDSGGSRLARIQAKLHSAAGLGGTLLQDWTDQVTGINQDFYTADWPLAPGTFNILPQGQSYVSVRALDNVGNVSNTAVDAFYVKKDTTAPTIANNLAAGFDPAWRKAGAGAIYDVDFADSGGAQISSITYSAWTGAGQTGVNAVDAVISSGTGVGNSYAADWSVNFDLLAHGTNYITVRVWDWASSSATLVDAFKVLKDTQVPADITGLTASPGPVRGSVKLEWPAPGDDGAANNNTQGGYVIKSATYNITTVLFDSASTYFQAWTPQNAGLTESRVLYGFEAGVTRYFAVKTFDKAGSTSAVSNVPSSLPQTANVYINEAYPSGAAAADDWVELFNNTASTFSLAGWTLVYDQGTIDLPGPELTVWTGAAVDRSSVNAHFVSPVTLNLNGAQSYHLILKDSSGVVMDRVQWPPLSAGQSFARIEDGNADFFEADPTPTKNYANAIATDPVKLNEVSYGALSSEFAELYNTGTATPTLSGYALRNSNAVKFPFTRKIYAGNYSLLAHSSVGDDLTSWTAAFGAAGLAAAGDYLALENAAGQTVDRVTWQSGAAYSLYNYKAALVSAAAYAAGGAANSIGRRPAEGADTGSDASDFAATAAATPLSRNNGAGGGAANTLSYPAVGQILPRKFPLRLTLGADSSGGTADNLALIRTGGAADNYSPHIYRLGDIGFDPASLAAQATVQTGVSFADQDGRPLVNGAVYRLLFNSDSAAASAPLITLATATYDAGVHTSYAQDTSPRRINEDARDDVLKFSVSNNSPSGYNPVEIATVTVRLLDSALNALTTLQARNIFSAVMVARDSVSGSTGAYESGIDIGTIAYLASGSISLDAQGVQVIPVLFPGSADSSITALSTGTFFIVAQIQPNGASQAPNVFRVEFDPGSGLVLLDGPSAQPQDPGASSPVQTASSTIITPAKPPAGTIWPYDAGAAAGVETVVGSYSGAALSTSAYYSMGIDGAVRAFNYMGGLKWIFNTSPVSPIRSAPWVEEEAGGVYVYFAADNGDVYKIKDNETSSAQAWKRSLGAQIRSGMVTSGTRLYFGASDGRARCLNKADGLDCAGWLFDAGINAAVSGTLSLDDYTPGLNSGWVGLENGKVVRLKTADGTVSADGFTTGGAVKSSPFVDAGWGGANNNLYVTSTDGKLYARTAANLNTLPANWGDFTTSPPSPIYSSPWIATLGAPARKYAFFGDESGDLYKVDASSGAPDGLIWKFQAQGAIRTMPVVFGGYVYFGTLDGYVYALDAVTGALRNGWPVSLGGAVRGELMIEIMAAGPDVLVAGASDGKTYMLEIGP